MLAILQLSLVFGRNKNMTQIKAIETIDIEVVGYVDIQNPPRNLKSTKFKKKIIDCINQSLNINYSTNILNRHSMYKNSISTQTRLK